MYLVSVVYHYSTMTIWDSFSRDITVAFASEIMELDFRPNTISGLKKIEDILASRHPNRHGIVIINLIPLEKERTVIKSDDDMG